MGIIGLAVLVGLCAGGIALLSGSSLLMAFGAYILFGWIFIFTAAAIICVIKLLKIWGRKENPAYSN
ncbi:hypothetical protein GS625_18945 [Ruegeria sp. HKCCD7319]|nr:hypothetical protein [Ruegeria sp. HKCCD7319]